MRFDRSAGVLLSLSSLPGSYGIGDLGSEAFRFIDFLVAAGQTHWQILPVGPSDHGNPYVAMSSWAGSPYYISLEDLVRVGDLTPGELDVARSPQQGYINFDFVARTRRELLARAADRFRARAQGSEKSLFEHFCIAEASWLDDWALFAALKKHFAGEPWWKWPKAISLRTPAAVEEYSKKLANEVYVEKYAQFRFYEQWDRLRRRAAEAGIRFIGDIPIYTAQDSADIWAAREMFLLKEDGSPKVVSGVPPDYFAKDGQLWGTPIYDWKKCEETRFAWWIGRLRGALRHADIVRLDHFRAFESYWEVPAKAATAREGRWVKGPGDAFFKAVREAFGEAPFIAEDLGLITKPVRELRDRWELPGMKVLQFAFGEGAASPHLPIRYVRNCVAYSGTHDNDTAVGWYESASERERDAFRRYTSTDGSNCHYHMIRLAYSSVADLAIVPMQDALGLGGWARMNVPATVEGNWRWKLVPEQVAGWAADMMRVLADTYGRLPGQKGAEEIEDAG